MNELPQLSDELIIAAFTALTVAMVVAASALALIAAGYAMKKFDEWRKWGK